MSTFAPAPTSLAITSGDGQTALAGAGLPAPLRVRVTASDGLGVKGEGEHGPEETLDLASLRPCTARAAVVIARLLSPAREEPPP